MSKYKNQKCECDGLTFDSKRELARYCELKILLKAGAIRNLELQVPFEIAASVVLDGRKRPARQYVADFVYLEKCANMVGAFFADGSHWQKVVEDSKGCRTETYRLKRHLLKERHGIEVREI